MARPKKPEKDKTRQHCITLPAKTSYKVEARRGVVNFSNQVTADLENYWGLLEEGRGRIKEIFTQEEIENIVGALEDDTLESSLHGALKGSRVIQAVDAALAPEVAAAIKSKILELGMLEIVALVDYAKILHQQKAKGTKRK